jgi:hypothetical protein
MPRVVLLGLLPSVVPASSRPGMTEEQLAERLEGEERKLRALGFDARWCLLDLGETAEAVATAALTSGRPDVVLIGAGVRAIPERLALFEKLVNVVHAHAPGAKICFNTRPDDTTEAVLRWIAAPSPRP